VSSEQRTQSVHSTAKAIFLDACELPPAQRMSLIDERCAGEPSLRAAVQSLLDANDRAGEFLEEPAVNCEELAAAVAAATADSTSAQPEPLPRMIGRYKLLELIGEGGFGAVYMAEQQDPVRRRVAVKVIKLGMDTRQVIARFEAERQALAMMDHPNIAQVFDAGADEAGRPYFVMELVRGIPITDYCDQAELSTRQRLELFISVCHAVQHAHQKGVIHRDIKPGNILVTLHDGTPVPKVIDFGIAKAMHQRRLTERTMFTAFRQFLGTPQYVSPEQAEMSGLDVDTRSDVYSLGALLYELLTGTTPLEEATLREAAYERVWQMVREADPPRPSTRVSTMGAARTAAVAARRGSDPGRLAKLLRGELDWVVMKALEKARERRYDSAGSLAADLRRYLDDEPVQARPTNLAYQLKKLALRHKTGVAAALAIGAALLIGISGTTIGMLRARAAQRRAQSAEQTALQERNAAREAQRRAEQSAADARREAARATAVGESMRGILGAVRPNVDAANPYTEVEQVLGTITDQLSGKLKDQPDEQIKARATLADSLQRAELYPEAIEQWRLAYELSAALPGGTNSRRTLDLACNLIFAKHLHQDGADAESLARRTRDAAVQSLGEGDPVTWKAIDALALTGVLANARRESHALWDSLIKRMAGDPARAQSAGDAALARYTANRAASLRERGRAAEADAAMAQALRVLREDSGLTVGQRARIGREISASLEALGDLPDALLVARDTLRDQRESLGSSHPATRLAIGRTVGLLMESDEFDEAAALLREYLPAMQADNPRGTITLSNRLVDEAWVKLKAGGDRVAAGERFAQSLAMRRRLLGHDDWVSEEDWRMWTMCCSGALLGTGWTSPTIRDHAWCALDDMLRDNAPDRLVPQEISLEQLRFSMLKWPEATKVAEGSLDELKKLPEPPAGLYLLGLQVPMAAGARTVARANWLLVFPWQVNVYATRRPDVIEANWQQAVAGEPAEQWQANALAINGGLSLVSSNGEHRRRWHWFGVIATTQVDLPPGRYRLSISAYYGAKVQLDGRAILGDWTAAGATSQVEVDLASGSHELRVDYYQKGTYQNFWLQVTPMTAAARTAAAALGGGMMPRLDYEIGLWRRMLRENPGDKQTAHFRAHALGRRGRFGESAAALGKAIELDPIHDLPWYVRACLLAHLGDSAGYQDVCSGMLARFGQSTDAGVCRRTAMACLVASDPPAPQQVQRARELIERAGAGGAFWDHLVDGLLDYRSGQFEQAAARLDLCLSTSPEGAFAIRAAAGMYLAMSQYRLRHEPEAQETFQRARMLMDANLGIPTVDDVGEGGLENWLIAHIARREAEHLMHTEVPADRP
jgi:serine/threonine protein kinase